jgi:hypothetical protein
MTKKDNGDKKKAKKPVPAVPALKVEATSADDKRAARNVAQIREKLSTALDDPQMREQIVRAMRSLMYEDKT